MCKLLTAVIWENDPLIATTIKNNLNRQRIKLNQEPHGLSSLVIPQAGKPIVARKMESYNAVIDKTLDHLPNARVLGFHARTATAGVIEKKNLHFWEKNGLYFAHNGWLNNETGHNNIYALEHYKNRNKENFEKELNTLYFKIEKCSNCEGATFTCKKHIGIGKRILKLENLIQFCGEGGTMETEWHKTDSLKFFEKLAALKKIEEESIKRTMSEESFTGIATLVDTNKKFLWLLATRPISLITDWEKYIIFYSFEPQSNWIEKTTTVWGGLPIITNEQEKGERVYIMNSGVYCLSYGTKPNKANDNIIITDIVPRTYNQVGYGY